MRWWVHPPYLAGYTVGGSASLSGGAVTCTLGTGTALGSLTYAYDQDGHDVIPAGTGSFMPLQAPTQISSAAYNVANQQTLLSNGLYALYDADGNQTCRNSTSASTCIGSSGTASTALATVTWNVRNRMSSFVISGNYGRTFLYDGLGRLDVRTASTGGATTYLYDGLNAMYQNNTSVGDCRLHQRAGTGRALCTERREWWRLQLLWVQRSGRPFLPVSCRAPI